MAHQQCMFSAQGTYSCAAPREGFGADSAAPWVDDATAAAPPAAPPAAAAAAQYERFVAAKPHPVVVANQHKKVCPKGRKYC